MVKSQGVFGNHDIFSNDEENFDKLSGIGHNNQYRTFKDFKNEKDVYKIHKDSKINATQESLAVTLEKLKQTNGLRRRREIVANGMKSQKMLK